ncbi:hypothetical protein [Streptomyces sp. SP18CS02]|uniref:hypothetical protein n=1 Tax=Streptomyces sp. SP18CS02 TaxID=3002531 RepID=UPI002E771BC2|nr:hypothetical protein [Streptomyces sp. SP18CS02]MEE1753909.1 hypothetical protein [Streptomyces sp. SP18CS02]
MNLFVRGTHGHPDLDTGPGAQVAVQANAPSRAADRPARAALGGRRVPPAARDGEATAAGATHLTLL